jgi:hypothetical protein
MSTIPTLPEIDIPPESTPADLGLPTRDAAGDPIYYCWRRRKHCRKCQHSYPAEEYLLLTCPECGEDRHCRKHVPRDGDACKFHGGESLKGPANPAWKDGSRSRYFLPANMMQDYQDFLTDPDRLALDRELALVRAILQDRVRELSQKNTSEMWDRAKTLYRDISTAREWEQPEREAKLFDELGKLLREGAGLAETRREIIKLTETIRKVVDTQRQLYVDTGEFITRGMALVMFGRFIEAVNENVKGLPGGPEAIQRIGQAVAAMAGRMGRPRLAQGSGDSPPA